MDMLEHMFEMQEAFQNRLSIDFSHMSTEEGTAYLMKQSVYFNNELQEMLYELPYFKDWKDYSNMTDDEITVAVGKAQEEFVDMLHFFINMAIGLGLKPDDLYHMYLSKHAANNKRQDDGYTHDKSYRNQPHEKPTVCSVETADDLYASADFVAFMVNDSIDHKRKYSMHVAVDVVDLGVLSKILIDMYTAEFAALANTAERAETIRLVEQRYRAAKESMLDGGTSNE